MSEPCCFCRWRMHLCAHACKAQRYILKKNIFKPNLISNSNKRKNVRYIPWAKRWLCHESFNAWWEIFQVIWLYSTMQVQLLLMTIGIFLYESDLNVWVHMWQAARTVPIAGTAWGRALLASCLHMLAADIPGNPKKISDNL